MKLGIEGRHAVVCASSRGLGKACARALAEAACIVVVNGRDARALDATAKEIASATGAEVILPLQRRRRLHHRPEPAHRRRTVPGDDVTEDGPFALDRLTRLSRFPVHRRRTVWRDLSA
jgi:NAD(P)-dependent dehydrogenase (short-subunit alcohol dehydrogenase family)